MDDLEKAILISFDESGECLHEVLRAKYLSMMPEEKSFIRKSVFGMACYESVNANDTNWVKLLDGPAFIKNKLAQVVVTLIYFDLDYPRTGDELAVAGRIKDAMRAQCVPQIVGAWYDIVLMYRNSDPELCASVLDSMRRYISWIDIGLIVNDAFTQLLFELMLVDGLPDQLRAAAAGVVLAVVSKRMDPKPKLALLQSLHMSRVFRLVARDGDSELVSSVASLLTGYATEVLECANSLSLEDGPSHINGDTTASRRPDIGGDPCTYSVDPMYRSNLDVLDKIGREEEDRMMEFRKDLFVLLRNIGRVAPDVTQIFIRNSLASAVSSSDDRNVEEVEAALSLFYELGESFSDDAMRNGSRLLRELVPMLLSTKFLVTPTDLLHLCTWIQ
ncbi:Exportin-T [Sesamum angolense]|uniref:Exportin-T n=1 Tax=Sesamum angolense TaxID=2727404 RepID=A0AAE1XFI2_9LAMI|nr:Exportin-T [Sesamum angolense]